MQVFNELRAENAEKHRAIENLIRGLAESEDQRRGIGGVDKSPRDRTMYPRSKDDLGRDRDRDRDSRSDRVDTRQANITHTSSTYASSHTHVSSRQAYVDSRSVGPFSPGSTGYVGPGATSYSAEKPRAHSTGRSPTSSKQQVYIYVCVYIYYDTYRVYS